MTSAANTNASRDRGMGSPLEVLLVILKLGVSCFSGPIAEDAGAAEHVEAAEASVCGLQVFRSAAERDHTHPHQHFRGQLRAAQPAASQRGAHGARIEVSNVPARTGPLRLAAHTRTQSQAGRSERVRGSRSTEV